MIKSLKIKNFQSHAKSTLEFSPGVNIIVGSTDSGKSAIIRALRWAIWNRPSGDAIRSNWGGKTSVHLEMEEGSVLRSKDKQDLYILKQPDQENTSFKAFSTSVPEEINRFLNINEINLQQQLDSPFLLSESPGKVASHFNKVAKLDKIDTSIQNIQKWIRSIGSDINHKQKDKDELIEDLTKYDFLEQFETELEELEAINNMLIDQSQNKNKLLKIIDQYQELENQIEEYEPLLNMQDRVIKLLDKVDEYNTLVEDSEQLLSLIKSIKKIEQNIKEKNKIIKAKDLVDELLQLKDDKDTKHIDYTTLENLIIDYKYYKEQQIMITRKKDKLQIELNETMPDICPLCNHKIKK